MTISRSRSSSTGFNEKYVQVMNVEHLKAALDNLRLHVNDCVNPFICDCDDDMSGQYLYASSRFYTSSRSCTKVQGYA